MNAKDPTRHHRQGLVPILALGALVSASILPAASLTENDLFQRYEALTGSAPDQTVLTGFLLDSPTANLVVLHIDENDDRRLRVYELEAGLWILAQESILRSRVQFVDMADIGGRDRLLTYEPGRLSWFDPDSATERTLMNIAAQFRAIDPSRIPHVDITRDLNRDGRDDVLIPDIDGFWVSTQSSSGSFTEPVLLGPAEPYAQHPIGNLDVGEPTSGEDRTWGEVGITAQTIPVYLSRVHEMDHDQDGRTDLVFWNKDHFEVHIQNEHGQFDPVAVSFDTTVQFDSEGAYSRAFEYSDQGLASLLFGTGKKTQRTVLHSLRDLNEDGVTDLVTLTLSGRSLTRQRSLYAVHLGTPTPEGIQFAPEAGTAIAAKGKAGGLQPWGYSAQRFEDLDRDGQVDFLHTDVQVGIGGMMRALVGNSVPLNLVYYRNMEGTFADEPTAKLEIRRFAPFDGLGNVFFPAVLFGDVTGDGMQDLLVSHSPKELHIYLGGSAADLLTQPPTKVSVVLPHDERNSWLVDLDRDGKQDLILHHVPTDRASGQSHRITTLIAR